MYANATQGTLQGGESLFMLTMLGLLIVLILLVISDLKIALATRFPNALAPEHLPPPNSYVRLTHQVAEPKLQILRNQFAPP